MSVCVYVYVFMGFMPEINLCYAMPKCMQNPILKQFICKNCSYQCAYDCAQLLLNTA